MMTVEEVYNLLRQEGVPAEDAKTLTAVAWGESGFNPLAKSSTNDYGLFQINIPSHRDKLAKATGSTSETIWKNWLYNPYNNAQMAVEIYRSQGLGAWTVYNEREGTTKGVFQQGLAKFSEGVEEPFGGDKPLIPGGELRSRESGIIEKYRDFMEGLNQGEKSPKELKEEALTPKLDIKQDVIKWIIILLLVVFTFYGVTRIIGVNPVSMAKEVVL